MTEESNFINNAIEATLKEYETLRTEILQNQSELNQLILLGLAAIFTIASLGLAPLADFLTEEDITIKIPEEIYNTRPNATKVSPNTFWFSNHEQKTNAEEITTNPNKTEKYLKITRSTNGDTIEKRGIVPNIVIFNWLIPGLSLYLIYRSLFSIQKNKMTGIYLYYRVERRLIKLTEDKDKSLPNMTFNQKSKLTNMAWENYVRQDPNYLEPLNITLIFVLFSVISLLSFVGGFILFAWDFGDPNFKLDCLLDMIFNVCSNPNTTDGKDSTFVFSLIFLVIVPLILWVGCCLFCQDKVNYIKSLDKPKKINKFNKVFDKVLNDMWKDT